MKAAEALLGEVISLIRRFPDYLDVVGGVPYSFLRSLFWAYSPWGSTACALSAVLPPLITVRVQPYSGEKVRRP